MIFLYNLSILILRVGVRIASLFNAKARAFVTGRKDIFRRLAHALETNQAPLIWFHCASLGEFEQGRPIIELIKKESTQYKILLTFFSPSGYEVRKNYTHADFVFYLPNDTASNAKSFVRITKPVLAFFVKYEYWHHFSAALKRQQVPLLSISSIFRSDQIFFKSYGGFFRKTLNQFTYFFVQNDASVKLLKGIGIDQCARVGDTRFDRVMAIRNGGEPMPVAEKFKANVQTWVLGSVWPEDLDLFIPFINESEGKLKFIVAPHEIDEATLKTIEGGLQVGHVRYSKALEEPSESATVLIVDNIGMLSQLYRYAEFSYVGGAFGRGLHNILEAACYGIPVFFGNRNYEKFQEARDLIMRGGAFDVGDYSDLKKKYELLISRPENYLLACEVTTHYVQENLGATNTIMQYARKFLK